MTKKTSSALPVGQLTKTMIKSTMLRCRSFKAIVTNDPFLLPVSLVLTVGAIFTLYSQADVSPLSTETEKALTTLSAKRSGDVLEKFSALGDVTYLATQTYQTATIHQSKMALLQGYARSFYELNTVLSAMDNEGHGYDIELAVDDADDYNPDMATFASLQSPVKNPYLYFPKEHMEE